MASSKGKKRRILANRQGAAAPTFTDAELEAIEQDHAEGLSVQQVVEAFVEKGERMSEATFRKYVQLGLLPRSRRVARQGKQRGSKGLYPPTTVRQLAYIRRLMGQGFTMEEIQRDFLFVRGDIEALTRQLQRVYDALGEAIETRSATREGLGMRTAMQDAREVGDDLVQRLEAIESHLTMRARMARAAV
ncbi:MAG: hypothetical protein CMM93_09290 [Rickettsiales bacterium]|nr:hypothetical protein [Rickettsiales bacterium]|tara:strand:- start:826 stop:1395 length:570 start_codon:yes stop_codon:yes gene_type:complete